MKIGPFLWCMVAFAAACSKENPNYTVRISMLNAVPNSASFTVAVAEQVINNNLQYGKPAFYLPAPAATSLVQWKRNSSAGYDSSFTTDLPNAADFTLLFFDSARKYQTVMMRDDWRQPNSNNQGYLRFLPMVVNATALRLVNDTGRSLVTGRSFADFKTNFTLRSFTAMDTTTNNTFKLYNGATLIDSIKNTTIAPGSSYTIYAYGVLNATGTNRPKLLIHKHE